MHSGSILGLPILVPAKTVAMEKPFLSSERSSGFSISEDRDRDRDDQASEDRRYVLCLCKHATLTIFLAITNILTMTYIFTSAHRKHILTPQKATAINDFPILEPLLETQHAFHWWTRYGSQNHTRDTSYWEAITPSHGFIAINHKQAAIKNWPLSISLPSDPSKGVYMLEAYHQLHCLVNLCL